jgi:FkbM family methyltransferase
MKRQVQIKSMKIEVELDGDYYGSEFWEKISARQYEPDTVGFIEDRCDSKTDFMDIGAANGSMTLIAASQGARVSSYEPDPKIHRVVSQNIFLSPSLAPLIYLQNKAISAEGGTIQFKENSNAGILSSIVFTGHDNLAGIDVEVLSLSAEIEAFHSDKARKLVIKMDIEGAEWLILKCKKTLEVLKKNNAMLLLAVHPGFYRPFVPRLRGIDKIRLTLWKIRNYRESLATFRLLTQYASIQRTNLNPIVNKHQFATLTVAGYHEFIIDFSAS